MQTAKLFMNGRSQAVRLPAAFRFEGDEVFIQHDEKTGGVLLFQRPSDWDGFLALQEGMTEEEKAEAAEMFARPAEDSLIRDRDPFADWDE